MSEPAQPQQVAAQDATNPHAIDPRDHVQEQSTAPTDDEFDSVDEDDVASTFPETSSPTLNSPPQTKPSETDEPAPQPEQSDDSDYDPFDLPVAIPTKTMPAVESSVPRPPVQEESDDEYDPTTAVPTLHRQNIPSIVPASVDVAPTAAAPPRWGPLPPQSSVFPSASQAPFGTASSASVTPTPTQQSALDQSVLQSLTIRLLADPSFLQLTDAEKQQRIAGEYLQLQNKAAREAAVKPAPPVSRNDGRQFDKSYSNNFQDRSQGYRKSYVPDPRAPHRPDLNIPLTPEEQAEFKAFLKEEVKYHSKYPHVPNSRVFVGNVPTNHMGKEALWRLFSLHGRVLEVSLKTPYAFIQYADPESAQRAIHAESGIPLYDKVMSLEIAKKARAEEMAGKRHTYRDRAEFNPRDRDRDREDSQPVKKRQLEVQIIIQPTADSNYARDVAREFENHALATDFMFQRPSQDVSKLVNDAAYSGVISVVLIHKPRVVDVQIYERTENGGVNFDEYVDLNVNDAIGLITKAKEKQRPSTGFNNSGNDASFGGNGSGYGRERSGYNQRDNNRGGYNNKTEKRAQRSKERPVPNRPLYSRNKAQSQQPSSNNGVPESLRNLTAEQFHALGAQLGYVQPSQTPTPQTTTQPRGQVPQSAIDQLLAGQPGAPNVQSLLDSLTKMK